MAIARPFAYNLGSTISGTEQIGSLSIGTPTSGFTGNPQYWNGPNEELGYVIAKSVSGNTQPTPVLGVTASVGFLRSSALTESSFIELANVVANGTTTFTGGTEAKTWLNSNGYWTSYGLGYSILLTSSDFSNGYAGFNGWNGYDYPSAVYGVDGTEGFTLTYYGGEPNYIKQAANNPYQIVLSNSAVLDFLDSLVTAGLLTSRSETVLWEVTWGPGSTYPTSYVSFGNFNSVGDSGFMAALDTSDPNWNQSGNSSFSLAGTFKFPALFTLVQPVVNKGGWC